MEWEEEAKEESQGHRWTETGTRGQRWRETERAKRRQRQMHREGQTGLRAPEGHPQPHRTKSELKRHRREGRRRRGGERGSGARQPGGGWGRELQGRRNPRNRRQRHPLLSNPAQGGSGVGGAPRSPAGGALDSRPDRRAGLGPGAGRGRGGPGPGPGAGWVRAAPAARGPRAAFISSRGWRPGQHRAPASRPRTQRAPRASLVPGQTPTQGLCAGKDSMLPGSPGPRGLGCSPAPPTSSARPGMAARWGINGRAGTSAPPTARAALGTPGHLSRWVLARIPGPGGRAGRLEVGRGSRQGRTGGPRPGLFCLRGRSRDLHPRPRHHHHLPAPPPSPRARGLSSPNGEPLVGDLETRAPTPAPARCPLTPPTE